MAADVFIGPGVTIGEGAVIGARSSVFKDMPAMDHLLWYPCQPIRPRHFETQNKIFEIVLTNHNQQSKYSISLSLHVTKGQNLSRCIGHCLISMTILVVDDGSTDHTVKVAAFKDLGAEGFVAFDIKMDFAEQRNWAMANGNLKNRLGYPTSMPMSCSHHEISAEIITKVIEADDATAGFYISRKTMLGKPIGV